MIQCLGSVNACMKFHRNSPNYCPDISIKNSIKSQPHGDATGRVRKWAKSLEGNLEALWISWQSITKSQKCQRHDTTEEKSGVQKRSVGFILWETWISVQNVIAFHQDTSVRTKVVGWQTFPSLKKSKKKINKSEGSGRATKELTFSRNRQTCNTILRTEISSLFQEKPVLNFLELRQNNNFVFVFVTFSDDPESFWIVTCIWRITSIFPPVKKKLNPSSYLRKRLKTTWLLLQVQNAPEEAKYR